MVTRLIGRHRLSAARWILLVSPPRERPIASRDGLVARFLSFAAAPCVHVQGCDDLQRHIGRRNTARSGGVLMSPYDCSIDTNRPVLAFGHVSSSTQLVEYLLVSPIA